MVSYFGIRIKPAYRSLMANQPPLRGKDHARLLLRRCRLEAGLRQADLARRLGQPQSFVSKYETGERRIDVSELREICLALEIPLSEFVRRLEEEHDAR